MSCDGFISNMSTSNMSTSNMSTSNMSTLNKISRASKKNCNTCDVVPNNEYLKYMAKQSIKNKNTEPEINEINQNESEDDHTINETYSGGSYCLDIYRYFKFNIKRYQKNTTLNTEIQPAFSYRDLDDMKTTHPMDILNEKDRDEVYQVYIKTYAPDVDNKSINLASFYIWMIENRCYLMDIFIDKLKRMYPKSNPFKKTYYILDSMAYLYNRRIVQTYNRFIKMTIDEEHQILEIPKNNYRIQR